MDRSDYMEMKSNIKGSYTQKVQIGWYDDGLVCSECEKLFGTYDKYASELLLQNEQNHLKLTHEDKLIGWRIEDVNFQKLKMFFLTILWRAGASDKFQFSKIQLGIWNKRIEKCIRDGSTEGVEGISFIIARFPDENGKSSILNPHKEPKGGIFSSLNMYRFYLGAGFIIYIKIDNRPFPEQYSCLASSEGGPLVILCRQELLESAEGALMKKILLACQR
ncbi:MAG: hypothetical protein UV68_C0046G0007 [Candidatus Collierbacteria bacterium GW2011_GWC2_43_12]|uniref:Uncharacterized protein n=1 Tax=Candidatus Collierbacteria bacterium GW2011_GWC2_43_12 TaxID=1618390 RepID=A0A0G1G0B1_9BACT|nr:MAG: hypothetical protein UV68_C0046G0007 [Candidatus Collierbacteria bacterium GW2011_GWC2_43_12]